MTYWLTLFIFPSRHPFLKVRYAGMTGAQIERARAKERGHGQGLVGHSSLSDEHHYAFLDMLQALTVSRRYTSPFPLLRLSYL